MKWFKHYENASTNRFLQALLMQKNGLELYAQWFLLLEFLCKEFKKDTVIFHASSDQLKTVLKVKQTEKLKKVLGLFRKFSASFDEKLLETSELSDNFWEIKTPIILELIGKDFKRTRQPRGSATAKKKEERIKKKKKVKKENLNFDFESLYASYPNKKGKESAFKKLNSTIKTQADFDLFSKAIKNYLLEIKNRGTEKKYIKHFSTFVNNWRDYLETDEIDFSTVFHNPIREEKEFSWLPK